MRTREDERRRRIRWIAIVVALIWSVPWTVPAFDLAGYQLLFHESGRPEKVPGPGIGNQGRKAQSPPGAKGGLTVFAKGNLVYFVQRGSVTIYRPVEGLLVRLPYDTRKIDDDEDGTKDVDFSKPPLGGYRERPVVVGIRDPGQLRRWDDVAAQPAMRPEFGFLGDDYPRQSAYVIVGNLPDAPDSGDDDAFDRAERYLGGTTAAAAMPDIAAQRAGIPPRVQPPRQDPTPAATSPEDVARLAARRFTEAAAVPKRTAVTVCSADNRVGYIEEIDGPRIKLVVTGRAVGNYREFGQYGPFDTALFEGPKGQPHAIDDPYFLFLPLSGPVKFVRLQESLWDVGRLWGICGYQ